MNELQVALGLLKYAVVLVPALGRIIRAAVDAFTPVTAADQRLVDQVKAVLPLESESQRALDEIVAGGFPSPRT